ncbi:CLUMA_CG007399, isoform A [Clunio marinus]|uniref:CLUMA_CG007399, isoform A n=1 Tax=Clunio marinus TaxID=568069 RepID=A0A1J1I0L1_9DIPT|nr:CLUMA_CG007399, isoform A [Clunio marinus]
MALMKQDEWRVNNLISQLLYLHLPTPETSSQAKVKQHNNLCDQTLYKKRWKTCQNSSVRGGSGRCFTQKKKKKNKSKKEKRNNKHSKRFFLSKQIKTAAITHNNIQFLSDFMNEKRNITQQAKALNTT